MKENIRIICFILLTIIFVLLAMPYGLHYMNKYMKLYFFPTMERLEKNRK